MLICSKNQFFPSLVFIFLFHILFCSAMISIVLLDCLLLLFSWIYTCKIIWLIWDSVLHIFFLLLILEREEGREKKQEKHIDVKEKHWLVASFMYYNWESNPQSRLVPWWGIKPVAFWFAGWCPTNWTTQTRADSAF